MDDSNPEPLLASEVTRSLPATNMGFIHKLPDEILDQIFETVYELIEKEFDTDENNNDIYSVGMPEEEQGNGIRRTNSTFAPIALACRRFHHIATPRLYRNLSCLDHSSFDMTTTLLLHRTLKQDPSLRKHCRRVMIRKPDEYATAVGLLTDDFISWMGHTRELILEMGSLLFGDQLEQTLGFVTASMPFLTRLDLYLADGPRFVTKVSRITEILEKTHAKHRLKSLMIHTAYSRVKVKEPVFLILEYFRGMSLKEIHLSTRFDDPMESALILSKWPVGLQKLTFSRSNSWSNRPRPYPYLESLLEISAPQNTLEPLVACIVLPRWFGHGVFDEDIPKEVCELDLIMLHDPMQWPGADEAGVPWARKSLDLLPKLATLRWNIGDRCMLPALRDGLAWPLERWWRDCALAVQPEAGGGEAHPTFKHMHVKFIPGDSAWKFLTTATKQKTDPIWMKFELLASEFREMGLELTWSCPSLSDC